MEPRGRIARLLWLVGGIVLGQVILYGPSLAGSKILLPLDILAGPGIYLPQTPEVRSLPIENIYLSDLVYVAEPSRVFAAREVAAGRWPTWSGFQYSGAPLLAPIYSPILGWQHLVATPYVLVWTQLWSALVAGVGAFLFWRRSVGVGYWPAVFGAWCYPLTAFFIFWQGYYTPAPVCLLPWVLLAVDAVVRSRSGFAPAALAAATAATLLSGALDIAGQVLLCSGLYALWRVAMRWREAPAGLLAVRLGSLSAAWLLGFVIAAHWVLPVIEYSRTGARIEARGAGREERPPTGLSALPQVVLPDMYGAFGVMKTGSFRTSGDSQQESSAAAYCGMAATLLAAPLAFCDRRRRPLCWFMAGLALFALSWTLNIPVLVHLLRSPGLNMMSHNRFVFAAAFALLTLAVIGLDVLRERGVRWQRSLWAAPVVLALLVLYCVARAFSLPEPIATQLEQTVQSGRQIGWIRDLESVYRVQDWFISRYSAGALLAGLTLAGWLLIRAGKVPQQKLVIPVGAFMLADLLWFGFGRNVQAPPALYFPTVPALAELAAASPGRVIGAKCLPANLAVLAGLNDVRGYDGVDPARYVELLRLAADSTMPPLPYALTQWQSPQVSFAEGTMKLHPVLDLLGVTHVVSRGAPPAGLSPAFQSTDYWVAPNPGALPRAFVPERVEVVADPRERLTRLSSPEFDPRAVCYLETGVGELPGNCRGQVVVAEHRPARVILDVRMETRGLVLLADTWNKGWHATCNGQPAEILRVNHALRGVLAPEGPGRIEFLYRPGSRILGLGLGAAGVLVLVVWTVLLLQLRFKGKAA